MTDLASERESSFQFGNANDRRTKEKEKERSGGERRRAQREIM